MEDPVQVQFPPRNHVIFIHGVEKFTDMGSDEPQMYFINGPEIGKMVSGRTRPLPHAELTFLADLSRRAQIR